MSPDQARELFSEAFDGELDAQRQEAFREALEADEALRSEYEEFVETLRLVGRLGEDDDEPPPDLLTGVQDRLRRRSRGRYYRDRFSRRATGGWTLSVIGAIAILLVLAVAYYLLQSTVVLQQPRPPAPAEQPRQGDDQGR